MIIALFVIAAAVVSAPIAAAVVVSVASRREDAAWSLGEPAQGAVQATARRLLDFRTEYTAWPVPKNCRQVRPAAPALHPIAGGAIAQRPARSTVTDTRTSAATPKIRIRTAA